MRNRERKKKLHEDSLKRKKARLRYREYYARKKKLREDSLKREKARLYMREYYARKKKLREDSLKREKESPRVNEREFNLYYVEKI